MRDSFWDPSLAADPLTDLHYVWDGFLYLQDLPEHAAVHLHSAAMCTAPASTCSRCPGCATWMMSSCACRAYHCHSPDAGLNLLSVSDSERDWAAIHDACYGVQGGCAVAGLSPQLPLALPSQHNSACDGAQAWRHPPLGTPRFVLPVLGSLFCDHSGSELLAECLLLHANLEATCIALNNSCSICTMWEKERIIYSGKGLCQTFV